MDLQSLRLNDSLGLSLLVLLGAGLVSSYALSLLRMLVDLVRPGISLKRFGAKKGAWAGEQARQRSWVDY